MSKLKKKIRNGLKKDSEVLLESLLSQSVDGETVRASVASISTLIEKENALTQERKKLSRLIGPTRADGKDPAALIDQVSGISGEIKAIDASIDTEVEKIAAVAKSDTDKTDQEKTDNAKTAPAHLRPIDEAFDGEVETLELAHDEVFDAAQWQEFVESQSHSSVYHDARWKDLIKLNFGHQPHYITCRKSGGELCGVFPLVHLKSRLFGSFLVSMPYFNYGGPLSSHPAVTQRMMDYAAKIGETLECTHFESRDTQSRQPWLCKQHKVTMILPLPNTDEALDKQLGTKVRAQVNRAAREGLEFVTGGKELLPEFYRVFSHNMRDLGTPVYSRRFFESILDRFDQQAFLAVVRHDGKPVAAGFLLGYRDKLEIPWASSLRKANPLGANMYMYRQILSRAIELKYGYFDFGRSSIGASTYKYKKQWGAIEHPLFWHYWLRDSDELPELNPDNPKYKLAINLWQRMPVAIANKIGPPLVRNLP